MAVGVEPGFDGVFENVLKSIRNDPSQLALKRRTL